MLERHFQTIKPVLKTTYWLTGSQCRSSTTGVMCSHRRTPDTIRAAVLCTVVCVPWMEYIAAIMTETLAWPTHYVVLNCWRFGSIAKSPLIYRLHPRPKSDESKTLCLSTLALGRMLLGFSCANRSTLYTVFCLSVLGRKLRVCQVCVVRCVITHPTFLELKHTKRWVLYVTKQAVTERPRDASCHWIFR